MPNDLSVLQSTQAFLRGYAIDQMRQRASPQALDAWVGMARTWRNCRGNVRWGFWADVFLNTSADSPRQLVDSIKAFRDHMPALLPQLCRIGEQVRVPEEETAGIATLAFCSGLWQEAGGFIFFDDERTSANSPVVAAQLIRELDEAEFLRLCEIGRLHRADAEELYRSAYAH